MDNSLNKAYKCAKCKKKSMFQCSGCHKEAYCSVQCQKNDWAKHKPLCLQEQNRLLVLQSPIVEEDKKKQTQSQLISQFDNRSEQLLKEKQKLQHQKTPIENKKVVIPIPPFPFMTEFSSLFYIKDTKKQIEKCYVLILTHRKHFLDYLETNPFKIFIEFTSSLYNKYKACLHYIQNYLLLIRLYLTDSNTDMAKKTLATLTKELFEEKLSETLNKIFSIVEKTSSKRNTSIKPQNIQIARQIYSSFLSSLSVLIKASKLLNMTKLYSKCIYKYIQIYHIALQSLNQAKEKQCSILRNNIYFIYGGLYAKDAQLTIALNLFNQATLNEYKDTLLAKIIYSSYFNQGAILYSMNRIKEAKDKALTALEVKLSLLNQQTMDDDQLRLIYLLLTEIEIENQNYPQANKYIDTALDTIAIEASDDGYNNYNTNTILSKDDYKCESYSREIDYNTNDKQNRIASKVIRLLRVLREKTVKLEEMNNANNREAQYDKIMSYLNDEMRKKKISIDNEFDISDIKNFFLFMTKLSLHQIDVLNKTQGIKVCLNLPILFSKDFKNTLNPAQRSHFDKLKKLSLIRSNVLKNIDGKIELENMKYEVINESDNLSIDKFQDYSQMKKFLGEIYPKINQSKVNASFNRKISELMLVNKKDKERRVSFLYKNEYNISKMKIALKIHLNSGRHSFNDEAVIQMREFVSSPLFNLLLNRMTLENIKELEKEPEVLCELLAEYMKSLEKNSNDSISEDSELDEIERVDTEINNLIKSENGDDDNNSQDSEHSSQAISRRKAMTFARRGIRRAEVKPRKNSFLLEEDDNLYV